MNKGYSVKFYDASSILIVNREGKIKRLYTPFKVVCIEDLEEIKIGTLMYVEEVATNSKDQLIYRTTIGFFLHKHFQITASF